MKNIDLSVITSDHVVGDWEVDYRSLSSGKTDVFTDIRLIIMKNEFYQLVNGKTIKGQWEVFRENEIIYNPQLKFFKEGQEIGNAIITRLCEQEIGEKKFYRLTLYFASGLELVLKKPLYN